MIIDCKQFVMNLTITENQSVEILRGETSSHMSNTEHNYLLQKSEGLNFELLLSKDQLESAKSMVCEYIGSFL